MRNHFFSATLLVALFATVFTACNRGDDLGFLSTEEYVDQALYSIQEEGNLGTHGCFELIFPISIELPDGTVETVDSYEALAEVIQNWRENNQQVDGRPQLVYPIEVISQDGELTTIENRMALRQLRRSCVRDFFQNHDHHGHRDRIRRCFRLTFPVTLEFPDGTTATVEDRPELKMTLRQWRLDNPDLDERPVLVFPLTVEMRETGELVTVESREDLQELRASCAD